MTMTFIPELDRLIVNLQLGEFVYEQPSIADIEYTFKHALTQEVAYNSVLLERRKQLHETVGRAIELIYSASLDDHVADLAHHFARSANQAKATTNHASRNRTHYLASCLTSSSARTALILFA
jgi:predicted ATPase